MMDIQFICCEICLIAVSRFRCWRKFYTYTYQTIVFLKFRVIIIHLFILQKVLSEMRIFSRKKFVGIDVHHCFNFFFCIIISQQINWHGSCKDIKDNLQTTLYNFCRAIVFLLLFLFPSMTKDVRISTISIQWQNQWIFVYALLWRPLFVILTYFPLVIILSVLHICTTSFYIFKLFFS
jgi:hypothetical protein